MLETLMRELKALRPVVWALGAGAVMVGVFLYAHRDWRVNQALYERGIHAVGTVTAKDLVGGKKVEYYFRAGEKTEHGESTGGYGNPPFASLAPDDQVVVFYLPEDPRVSVMGDPKTRVEDQHRWLAWPIVIFGAIFAGALAAELKRHE